MTSSVHLKALILKRLYRTITNSLVTSTIHSLDCLNSKNGQRCNTVGPKPIYARGEYENDCEMENMNRSENIRLEIGC